MNRRLLLFALTCAIIAAPVFAASYVVPPDDIFVGKSDTIVIARAVTSYSLAEPDGNIVTITEFALEQTVKGFADPTVQIRIPGGSVDGRIKMVSGAPAFSAGTDYLLFLRHTPNGGMAPTDFGLGVFAFSGELGRQVVQRSAEVFGWDLDGSDHVERKRDAAAFLRYVRSVVAGGTPSADYLSVSVSSLQTFRPTIMATSFTGTSYTVSCGGGGEGCTWTGFPVNFNQGSSESGAPGTPPGKSAITSAFASWNGAGAGISYVYATNNANSNGILDATDHVNNIVFDKDLSGAGAPAYNCASGGVLGLGGISSASGTHSHNGETYVNNSEVDVSMNQGIANCTALFNSGDFTTAVTHEVGHTLGLRHSDQTRADNPSTACSTDPTLDCASGTTPPNTAVMRSSIAHNISGALQNWDRCAVNSIYGSGTATPSISAQPTGSTITSGSQATLSVTATSPAGVTQTYQWYIGVSGSTASPIGGGTTASIQVSPASTTSYWVRITGCGSTDSTAATVTVNGGGCTAPSISVQPAGSTITQGNSTSVSVTAAGTAPFTYQWYIGTPGTTTTPVAGGTTASINVSPSSTTSYWVLVNNSCGPAVNSNAATVTVNPVSCTAPQVTSQPTGSTITFGSSAQLSVVASGTATLTYQWYTSPKGNTSSPVFNATTASIQVNPQSTTTYWVRVTNSCGTADSNTATVTVNCLAPNVSATPPTRTITSGSSTIFSAIASGGPNMTFQWYQGIAPDTSNPLAGQTGNSLTVSPTASTTYWVQATVPGCGTGNSNTVSVTVNPNNGCPSVTIATPTAVQNGANYMLTTSASTGAGGGTVTITWYQQTNSGQTAIGTGTSISVSPTVTTTYLAQATNTCGSSNSATVTVTITPSGCTAPTLTKPPDEVIGLGASTTIVVVASGSGTLHYQWFKGLSGDTTIPVGTDAASFTTGSLTATGTFWVKVTNDCGSLNSGTVTVTVEPARHRSVHH